MLAELRVVLHVQLKYVSHNVVAFQTYIHCYCWCSFLHHARPLVPARTMAPQLTDFYVLLSGVVCSNVLMHWRTLCTPI